MATIFVSPGVYTKEQDFTVFASRIGITRLGLVGITERGPAFLPTLITSTDQFLSIFGSTDPNLPLSYVANSFLAQSNELTVTRVLGNDGFVNSGAWLIVADYSTTYSGVIVESGMTFSIGDQVLSTGWTFTTASSTAMTTTISAVTVGNNINIEFNSLSGSISTTTWINTINSTSYSGFGITEIGDSSNSFIGTGSFTLSANSIEPKGEFSGATLAVLRSKRDQVSGEFYFTDENQITIGNVSTTLGNFILSASTGPLTAQTNSGYTVSLDETSTSYIVNILTENPEISINGTLPNLYVERIYPHFIREANNRQDITGLNLSLIYSTEDEYTNFQDGYSNAVTPYVVSRVIGGHVKNLFRFQTIADGDTANTDIKISIQNIDIVNLTFDVVVRDFEDTDSNPLILETWASLTLNPANSNYIGIVIGTTDEVYPQQSMYITVDIADSADPTSSPAGFGGYYFRGTGISGSTSPQTYYKTTYLSADTIYKTYLGISELAYTSLTQNLVSTKNSVKSLEQDLYEFDGADSTGEVFIKGFHMENIADPTQFISGDEDSLTGYTNASQTLIDKTQLKFTLVPQGGFDGFDKYRYYDSPYEQFTDAYQDNIAAFQAGIDMMSAPEVVDINLFSTPGIDLSNNQTLVRYGLNMIQSRADSLYIIDSPRLTVGTVKGTPEQLISELEDLGVDSNYAATYWPWIQIIDQTTNIYTYQPPTLMVVNAIAFTDNIAAPWFAPAGLTRGLAGSSIVRADVRLTSTQRDTLYQGRVNPIATFIQQGVIVWGQKTLQVNQSALNRVNVRRLLLQVRRLVAAASLTLVFEQNDQTLIDQFLSKVEPILLQIQNQRGLTAFNVVMNSSNNTPQTIDQNTLVGKIQLQPTRTAEFIDLTFQVLPTGAAFADF